MKYIFLLFFLIFKCYCMQDFFFDEETKKWRDKMEKIENGGLMGLLNEGVDIDKLLPGTSLLHLIILRGEIDNAEMLIMRGADVNLRDQVGYYWSPLFSACQIMDDSEFSKFVILLLRQKANVNLTDQLGLSPLYQAVKYDNKKTVELLLEHKADVDKAKLMDLWSDISPEIKELLERNNEN